MYDIVLASIAVAGVLYLMAVQLHAGRAVAWPQQGVCRAPAVFDRPRFSCAESTRPAPRTWRAKNVASLFEAEQLLDQLEADGFGEREFTSLGDGTFTVRWR